VTEISVEAKCDSNVAATAVVGDCARYVECEDGPDENGGLFALKKN